MTLCKFKATNRHPLQPITSVFLTLSAMPVNSRL